MSRIYKVLILVIIIVLIGGYVFIKSYYDNKGETIKRVDFPSGIKFLKNWKYNLIAEENEIIHIQIPVYDFDNTMMKYPMRNVSIEEPLNITMESYSIREALKDKDFAQYTIDLLIKFPKEKELNHDFFKLKLVLKNKDESIEYNVDVGEFNGKIIKSDSKDLFQIESWSPLDVTRGDTQTFTYETTIVNKSEKTLNIKEIMIPKNFEAEGFTSFSIQPNQKRDIILEVKTEFKQKYLFKPAIVTNEREIVPLESMLIALDPTLEQLIKILNSQ